MLVRRLYLNFSNITWNLLFFVSSILLVFEDSEEVDGRDEEEEEEEEDNRLQCLRFFLQDYVF